MMEFQSHRITEGHGKTSIVPLFQSGAITRSLGQISLKPFSVPLEATVCFFFNLHETLPECLPV